MEFPRVDTGLATEEEKSRVKELVEGYEEWKALKVSAAMALIRTGAKPYRKPPAAVIAKRRARNKRARIARRAGR